MIANEIYTNIINNATLTYSQNATQKPFTQISFLLTSGAATLVGTATATAINLPLNVPVSITTSNNLPIYDFVLTATSGTVTVLATRLTNVN